MGGGVMGLDGVGGVVLEGRQGGIKGGRLKGGGAIEG